MRPQSQTVRPRRAQVSQRLRRREKPRLAKHVRVYGPMRPSLGQYVGNQIVDICIRILEFARDRMRAEEGRDQAR